MQTWKAIQIYRRVQELINNFINKKHKKIEINSNRITVIQKLGWWSWHSCC